MTCRRYEPGSNNIPFALGGDAVSAFPIERQNRLLHNTFDFGANYPFHVIPACHLPVRFAVYVTISPRRLGTRLLAKLYLDNHFRLQCSLNLQGVTLTPPYVPLQYTAVESSSADCVNDCLQTPLSQCRKFCSNPHVLLIQKESLHQYDYCSAVLL
jgi:hypothetical protein